MYMNAFIKADEIKRLQSAASDSPQQNLFREIKRHVRFYTGFDKNRDILIYQNNRIVDRILTKENN